MDIRKITLLVLTISIIAGCFLPWTVHADSYNTDKLPAGCNKAAESETLALYYTADTNAIYVLDKRNGYVWSSDAASMNFKSDELNNYIKSITSALFDFKYMSVTNKKYAIISVDMDRNKPEVNIEKTDNGIDMRYNFSKLGISVTVKILLDENSITVRIPADKIKEGNEYKLVSISLMPYFGASKNSEKGYIFYPDGSGALFRFKNEPRMNISVSSFYIYGTDSVDLQVYSNNEKKNIKTAMLPVFGIKKGDNAVVGIISEGDYNSAVNFTPSGFSNIQLNRISTEFTCRRTYKDLRNDPDIPARIENDIIAENRSVRYCFLNGDQADYSGMANECRNYLLDADKLVSKIPYDKSDIPLGIDIFMGIKEKRLLFDKYIAATTFSQAHMILEQFSKNGVNGIQVNLIGWDKNGYGANPSVFEPSSKLGGIKGLNKLSAFTKEKGYTLYLDSNFVDASKGVGGYSLRSDMVHSKNGLLISNKSDDKYLLTPYLILKKFISRYLPKMENAEINGLSFERIGSRLYHDYNSKATVTREQTADCWNRMLDATSEKLGDSGSDGGNAYVLSHVNRLFNIPVEDSGNLNTDEAIPFYQMVVHGYIPYSSDPGNLFYDAKSQKLKWVEYGCMPYFKLTYSEADILKYTQYNALFSSCYKDWTEMASDIYKEFNTRLNDLWDKEMVKHEKVADNVFKVTYEDDTRVYINYNETDVHVDYLNIKAQNYLVVDREGSTR